MASDKYDLNKQVGSLAELADMIDAARYRWLRNKARKLQGDKVPYVVYGDGDSIHGEQLDTAIDALIVREFVAQQITMRKSESHE